MFINNLLPQAYMLKFGKVREKNQHWELIEAEIFPREKKGIHC